MKAVNPILIISHDRKGSDTLQLLIQHFGEKLGLGNIIVLSDVPNAPTALEFVKMFKNAMCIGDATSISFFEELKDGYPQGQFLLVSRLKKVSQKAEKLGIPFCSSKKGNGQNGLCQHLTVMLT